MFCDSLIGFSVYSVVVCWLASLFKFIMIYIKQFFCCISIYKGFKWASAFVFLFQDGLWWRGRRGTQQIFKANFFYCLQAFQTNIRPRTMSFLLYSLLFDRVFQLCHSGCAISRHRSCFVALNFWFSFSSCSFKGAVSIVALRGTVKTPHI